MYSNIAMSDSSEAADVFSAGTHQAHTYTMYIHIHRQAQRSDTHQPQKYRHYQWPHPSSVSERDEGPLVTVYTYTDTVWIFPAAGLRHSVE